MNNKHPSRKIECAQSVHVWDISWHVFKKNYCFGQSCFRSYELLQALGYKISTMVTRRVPAFQRYIACFVQLSLVGRYSNSKDIFTYYL